MRLFRFRVEYFSCSKFADWVRGVKKPTALSLEDWEDWRISCKNKSPIRYWMAEKGLSKIQNLINFPMDVFRTIENYIHNRFIDKTHYLDTKLKPGEYYEFDYRLLHGIFEEFVDFVEIECAALAENKKKYKFHRRRCAEAGIDHLKWSASLVYDENYGMNKNDKDYNKPTTQAISAHKQLELYNWWKNRPNRPDPIDASGWGEFCKLSKEEQKQKKKEKDKAFKSLLRIEKQQENEDTKMMIELIKIRNYIWT